MTDINMTTIRPSSINEEGDIIDLPENIGRVDTFHDNSPSGGVNFEMAVVGNGETEEHVLLKAVGEDPNVEDGAQILAADVERMELWYAIPLAAYGGGSE